MKSGLYTHERWQLGSGSGVRKNERNKPMEGKLVLCWIVIKKEKMVIKYIMENVEHTQGMVVTADKTVFY